MLVPIFLHKNEHVFGVIPGFVEKYFPEAEVQLIKTYLDEKPKSEPEDWLMGIFMGGAESITELHKYDYLQKEVGYIKKLTALKKPILGICLGGQMISVARGFKVDKTPVREYGYLDVEVTNEKSDLTVGLPKVFKTYQWHEDCFQSARPPILSSKLQASQAADWDDLTFGTQFHPELDHNDFLSWTKDLKKKEEGPGQVICIPSEKDFPEYRKNNNILLDNYFKRISKLVERF